MSRYSQSDHGSNHDADASDLEAGGSDGAEEGGVDEVNESVEEGKSNYDDRYGDEDGVSFLDHQVNEAIQQRREEKEKARAAGDLAFVENVDEKLGDDFEDTPWVPPTLELAWEYRLSKLYRGGKAKLSKVALTRATDIGLGVPLYFIFVKTIGLAALLMTFLSLPALLFAYTGHNIKDEDRDAFGLYKLSIGNIGHNKDSGSYDEKSACSTITDMRCVKLFGEEFSMLDVANILSVCEVSSAMVCLFAFVYLVRTHAKMNKRAENRTCSISDYSVMVENVPPDVTMDELIQHFSELYPLDKPDWKQRPGVEGAEPVKHSTNSGFSAHKGTWVAEATVFTKIGAMIRQFKSKQMLMDNLLRCRAKMKMYAENTCHAHGPNPGKFRKAEREMMETGIRIDKLTTESLKQARRKLTGGGRFSQKLHENASNLPGGIPAEALVAFVVFNYSESMARCVEDYEHYNSFPFKLFMPKKLMLRGRHIRVVRGPEPDEIMWENLEVSSTRKFLRRSFSAAVALCLILFGFAFVLQAARYKAKFDEDVPKLAFCDSEIPAVYGNTYDLPAGVQLVRPDVEKDDEGYTRDDYDLECSTLDSGSFYAIYTEDGNVKRPLTEYSTMACIAGDCPIAGANMSCPCVTTTSTENCQTLHCFTDENWDCSKFKAGTIGGCFCYQELLRMFASSFLGMVSDLMSQDDACADFFSNYALAMGLSVAAALCTVAINVFLKKSMKYLATGEFHVTVDEEQSATIAKVFAATYINMAFVALAAYGLWKDKPSVLRTMQIFHGDFADFTPQWYAVVGSYLVTTFIFQMFGPMGVALLKYYIIFPCRMCRAHPKISAQASHKYAMQADVNALELGGTFDTTVNNAQLLSLFFFGMTYAPGLPFMMPLLLLAYVMYFRVDKMLLMRFYERPPKMGDAVMRVVLMLMPWAIVIRLGVACWMYSSTSLFPYHRLKLNEIPNVSMLNFDRFDEVYNEWVIDHRGKDILFFNTGTRIMRGTVFPLFCLMVVIAVSVILFKLMRHSPLYYLFNMFNWLRNHLKLSRVRAGPAQKVFPFELAVTGDPLRAEVAPFTGDYFQFLNSEFDKSRTVMRCLGFLKKFVAPDLTEEELQQGWRVSYNGPYKVKMCQWAKATRIADAARPAGSVQRTYEMISCHGCWSYQLQRIPMYKKIMIAIMEGMESVAHDIENEAGGGTGAGSGASGHMSVLAKYEKRQNDKKTYHTEKQKAKEAVWKNPGPGVKKGRIQPVSDEQLFDAIDRDCDDMDSPQRKDSDSSDDSDDD